MRYGQADVPRDVCLTVSRNHAVFLSYCRWGPYCTTTDITNTNAAARVFPLVQFHGAGIRCGPTFMASNQLAVKITWWSLSLGCMCINSSTCIVKDREQIYLCKKLGHLGTCMSACAYFSSKVPVGGDWKSCIAIWFEPAREPLRSGKSHCMLVWSHVKWLAHV